MVYKCCVPACSTNYRSKINSQNKLITIHRFPSVENDRERYQRWIKSIPRAHWTPTKHSRICSKHFDETDFTLISVVSNNRRKRQHNTHEVQARRLSSTAVPSICPALPKYLSTKKSKRTTVRTTERRQRVEKIKEQQCSSEQISKFSDLLTTILPIVESDKYFQHKLVANGEKMRKRCFRNGPPIVHLLIG